MTQVRLSVELNAAQETISAYESRKHYPSVKSLLKMADLFDASCDYILGISDIRKPQKENLLNNDEATMLSLFKHLSSFQKEKGWAYIQGLSDQKNC